MYFPTSDRRSSRVNRSGLRPIAWRGSFAADTGMVWIVPVLGEHERRDDGPVDRASLRFGPRLVERRMLIRIRRHLLPHAQLDGCPECFIEHRAGIRGT